MTGLPAEAYLHRGRGASGPQKHGKSALGRCGLEWAAGFQGPFCGLKSAVPVGRRVSA